MERLEKEIEELRERNKGLHYRDLQQREEILGVKRGDEEERSGGGENEVEEVEKGVGGREERNWSA